MKKKLESVFPYISSEVLERELECARFVKYTERGENKIYVFSGRDCPYLMLQIGILREVSFRNGGGGTGLAIDVDCWDEFSTEHISADAVDLEYLNSLGPFLSNGFKQLIIWDPENKEIIGGYRYAEMSLLLNEDMNMINSPSMELFDCSLRFFRAYAPYTIELGRSFVQPKYQLRGDDIPPRKAMYALDNLFEGLGTLVVDHKIQYFFGKVTMYKTYNRQARNMILYYMEKNFPDYDQLVYPKTEFIPPGLKDEIDLLETIFIGNSEREDKKILKKSLRKITQGIPPLFDKYTEMSPTMKVFGTAINYHCGEVEETSILIKIEDIVEKYKKNYILNYLHKKLRL